MSETIIRHREAVKKLSDPAKFWRSTIGMRLSAHFPATRTFPENPSAQMPATAAPPAEAIRNIASSGTREKRPGEPQIARPPIVGTRPARYLFAVRRDRDRQYKELGRFDRRRGETLADDLDLLLGDLCRLYGFCNHLSGAELLRRGQILTAERFAHDVLVAEGFDEPQYEVSWTGEFRRIFTLRYGARISQADYRPADGGVCDPTRSPPSSTPGPAA
jgi:hypothetical protein